MNTINVIQLRKLLGADPNLPVLDVRTPLEFKEVHVAQAHNVPLDVVDVKALRENGSFPNEKPVYILCRSGGRATKAAEKLTKEGFGNAIVVEGGTQAWIDAGFPVERGEVKVISLERQVRIAAGGLVLTGTVLGWFVHPAFFAVPAFVGAGLVFAGVTDWCGMGLLLARAPWNR